MFRYGVRRDGQAMFMISQTDICSGGAEKKILPPKVSPPDRFSEPPDEENFQADIFTTSKATQTKDTRSFLDLFNRHYEAEA